MKRAAKAVGNREAVVTFEANLMSAIFLSDAGRVLRSGGPIYPRNWPLKVGHPLPI
jgi:hypothetical protein